MADDNDTGSGGINLDGDLYTFDVAEPNSPEDAAGGKQGSWSPGRVSVDKTIKDLSKPTRETFAKYLSKTTMAKAGSSVDVPARPNPYPVGTGDATTIQEASLKDINGNPTRPLLSPNESQFAPEFNQTMGAPPPLFISKGYTINPVNDALGLPTAPDGNSLLRNATKPADTDPTSYIKSAKGLSDPLRAHVSSVLKINRFNPVDDDRGNFIPDYLSAASVKDVATKQFDANASFARPDQMKFGASAGNDDVLKREYGFKRLARIAPVLQQNATFLNSVQSSELQSSQPGGNVDSGQDFTLPIERINIENIVRDLSTDVIKQEQIVDFGSKFETVLNNLVDRFSNLASESQIAVASALVSAVFKATEILDAQIGEAFLSRGTTKRYGAGGGRQGTGTYYGGSTEPTSLKDFAGIMTGQAMSAKKLEFLNIRPTSRPFRTAVLHGMRAFFNTGNTGGHNSPPAVITRPTKNTNYTLILARSIIRSSTRLTLSLKEISESKTLNGDERAYEIAKVIRESRLIGIFNFFAQLGDAGLDNTDDPKPLYDVTVPDLDNGRKISIIDVGADNSTSTKHGKSRLAQGRVRKLAWAMSQTPDLLLGPAKKDEVLRDAMGGAKGLIASLIKENDPTTSTRINMKRDGEITPRLSTVQRANIENHFESEYVPFYFHDIRTNEIVGFHAFILSLSEDYSANYENVEGYGRIEPVKIYKSTQRKISVSFIAAATDTNDFDTLWYKINKLTTFVYPQYTPGKKVGDSGGRFQFTKPFTQQVGASPMIRIRLGNLFRSNYSKFNLSKIFGLNEDDAVLGGVDQFGAAKTKLANDKERSLSESKRNVNIAKGASAEATRKREIIMQSIYDNEYLFAINMFGATAKLIVVKQPSVEQEKVPKVDATPAVPEKLELDAYFAGYGLVCRVEGVAVIAPGQPENITFENYDYSKSYDQDTKLKIKFELMNQVDWEEKYGYGPDDSKQNSNPPLKKPDIVVNGLKICHDKYKRDVNKKLIPNIDHSFLIDASYVSLDNMILASQRLFASKLNAALQDEEATEKNVDLAIVQQGIDDKAIEAEFKKRLDELPAENEGFKQKFADRATDFMNSGNNSIVRSFSSVGGKGLAGFIESLQFDWMTGPWDTDIGRKAPKMCKVTLTFAPVHDIAPGLDSNGQNRAPLYPIGPYTDNNNKVI